MDQAHNQIAVLLSAASVDSEIVKKFSHPDFCLFKTEDHLGMPANAKLIPPCPFPIKACLTAAQAYTVYDFFRSKDFSSILFLDCPQWAFYLLQSKQAGLHFQNTHIISVLSKQLPEDFQRHEDNFIFKNSQPLFSQNLSIQQLDHWLKNRIPPTDIVMKLTTPTISVCIPHHNRWSFLKEALLSLNAQTYKNFDVMIIDDCSDDSQKKNEFHIWSQENINFPLSFTEFEKNSGPGMCRNHAAWHSPSDYVLFMDDDNLAKPNELEFFLKAALHTKADIVTCAFDNFCVLNEDTNAYVEWGPRNIFLGADVYSGRHYNCFGDTNSFFKRSVYNQLQGFFEDNQALNEDWELLLRASQRGYHLVTIPESLFMYRRHSQQRSLLYSPLQGVNKVRATAGLEPVSFIEPAHDDEEQPYLAPFKSK